MIKLLLPALILAIMTTITTVASADSLVCQYFINGEYKTLIYTEVPDAKDNEIETVYRDKRIFFGNSSYIQIYVSDNTDCIFINDNKTSKQVALNYFLNQIGINQELE